MLNPSVQVRQENGVLVAEFWDCHRLDPAPVQQLRKELDAHVRGGGRPVIAVDLLGVGFAGSAALGGFLAIRKQGARLIFFNVEPTVLEVFKVSRLAPLFTFAPDRDAALAAADEPDRAHSLGPAQAADGSPATPKADSAAAPPKAGRAPTPPLRRSRTRPGGPPPEPKS